MRLPAPDIADRALTEPFFVPGSTRCAVDTMRLVVPLAPVRYSYGALRAWRCLGRCHTLRLL
jgi:hypothetical protein